MKFAWVLSFVFIAAVGFGGANSIAGEPENMELQACNSALLLSKVDDLNVDDKFADGAIQHGTFHPCKDDPEACGAGVCCYGHCYPQGTVCN